MIDDDYPIKAKKLRALLEDETWKWRTENILKLRSGMDDEEFEKFRQDNRLIPSGIPDVLGNKLWKLPEN